jgi:hypothetical protein
MVVDATRRYVLAFIDNAMDDGWSVRKKGGSYIFSKPHEGKKQVFTDEYLVAFVEKHMAAAKCVAETRA